MSSIDLAVWSADCAPIVLIGDDGCVVAAHGGWRGLAAGVVDVAIDAVLGRGAQVAGAVLGPVIHPCCYAFGADEMGQLAAGVHTPVEHVAGRTSSGELALDVPAAVRRALSARGVELDVVGPCTGCDGRWFSHRVRGEAERQATVVSIEETT
jgi:copper oxidase (laccase) domain-containing protein